VNVRRPPPERVVLPRIGAGLDRHDAVAALVVREHLALAEKIGIERRVVVVNRVGVFPGRVGLPYLDERLPHRPSVLVEEPADEHHLLAERRARAPGRQISLALRDELLRKNWPRRFERTRRHAHQRLRRRPEPRALVVRVEIWRVDVG
jgi:hypothetical protein